MTPKLWLIAFVMTFMAVFWLAGGERRSVTRPSKNPARDHHERA